eukprot:CAMPEP_0198210524 /NCGR_PEP_ID=MMETSP1445-20131203/20386_1 /TAXON_ID=36898 /ORGANISM="Pyramimonas sp., Strain CCMP2087" /LENGTH=100 /DNA_ID=CAMNT_0043884605 /DNA_START=132 /DNA_END=434 /DNA_ORIENTATION=+
MAYNLYQVQMAQAWKERVDKETAMAEKAQVEASMARGGMDRPRSVASYRSGESRSTKRSYNTQVLRSRLDELEAALNEERTIRLKVEKDLHELRQATQGG